MLCQGSVYREFFANESGLSLERCPVVKNWTATRQLLDVGAAREPGHSDAVAEILFLGWIEREKGIFDLLECVRRLADALEVPPFRVMIAGDGSAMADAGRRIEELQLAGIVQLLGWIDSDTKVARLRRADVLVLPSYMEGMPNSIIEAMAAGLPVVATSVGAVPDIVKAGISGFIIPPGDIERLFAALRELLLDSGLRARMGRAGWEIASEEFSTEQAVDKIVELTERLCGRVGSARGASWD